MDQSRAFRMPQTNPTQAHTHTHINAGAGLKIPPFQCAYVGVCVSLQWEHAHIRAPYATNGIASSLIPGPAMQNMPAL